MKRKVKFINVKYTDVFQRDQVLTVKDVLEYAWHETFTFEEVDGEYGTIFFEDVMEDCLNYEPLTEEKKQELVEFRKSRQQYLQDREEYDPWVFVSSYNFETGCGHSTSILMSQCLACEPEDHNNPENPYEITTTKEYRAERKFRQIFGDYDANFLEFHTREEFFEKWDSYIPIALLTVKDEPCYIEFFMRLHYNFS